MAQSLNKTYSITLKYSYEGGGVIAEDDLHVEELRKKVIAWIDAKVAHISQGNLSVHIVGEITET